MEAMFLIIKLVIQNIVENLSKYKLTEFKMYPMSIN